MSDLEWYLDVGGKQSGPHSAKEIVELVRAGKIPASSQVTAARMSGDWVTAQDLIDAYDELYVKKEIAKPGAPTSQPFTSSHDPNFTAPPRPTEQLERSKLITISRQELDNTPDPTEALFQAIQAVREKANQKSGATPPAAGAQGKDTFGQLARPPRTAVPPQLLLILTLAAIFGVTIYGVAKLLSSKNPEEVADKPVSGSKKTTPPSTESNEEPIRGSLLNDKGGGASAARTAPPVQIPPKMTDRAKSGQLPTRDERGNRTGMGGARYRDEYDPPVDSNEGDLEEGEIENPRENSEPVPVDPSQVPADRIIPEAGNSSVKTPGDPGADTYQGPPPAGAPQ